MNNFKPGGLRHRRDDLGGRPKSDANYGAKRSFDNKPRFDKRGGDREVQLFEATCTTCGKSCEVPFRPDGTKPVLCRTCFAEKNSSPAQSNSFSGRDRFSQDERPQRRPERPYESARPQQANVSSTKDYEPLVRQITAIDAKLNQIMDYVKALEVKIATTPAPVAKTITAKVSEEVTETPVVKIRKPKKVVEKKVVVKKAAAKVAKKVVKKVVKKAKK